MNDSNGVKRRRVLTTARRMAKRHGLINVSMLELCDHVGLQPGSFAHVMGCGFIEMVESLIEEEGIPITVGDETPARAMTKPLRRAHLLKVAVEITRRVGTMGLTRVEVAERAGVSRSLVSSHFPTLEDLHEAVYDQFYPEAQRFKG